MEANIMKANLLRKRIVPLNTPLPFSQVSLKGTGNGTFQKLAQAKHI